MTVFIALLRAVNVGGANKIAMSDLRELCQAAGFENVTTHIQSGNVVFKCSLDAEEARRRLEEALRRKMGKPIGVFLRTPEEMKAILERNPFETAPPNQVIVLFLDHAPPRNALTDLKIPGREQVELSGRQIYIHFPEGMGRSKLKIPLADRATGRNLNTVRKLFELSVQASGESPPARPAWSRG